MNPFKTKPVNDTSTPDPDPSTDYISPFRQRKRDLAAKAMKEYDDAQNEWDFGTIRRNQKKIKALETGLDSAGLDVGIAQYKLDQMKKRWAKAQGKTS